jgi:polyisoprenoid-binding protein YceI
MTTEQKTTALTTWAIDKSHSNVDFSVKHLVISTVRGHFRDFDATLHIDEDDPERSSVTATVEVASVDTNEANRDAHLRSDDFFNADDYPQIRFQSTRLERLKDNEFRLHGDLTIRDVTRPVVLDGEFEGRIQDPWGNERIAFSARTEISRQDYNVRWNQLLEAGGAVVSDRVKISLYVEAVRQP